MLATGVHPRVRRQQFIYGHAFYDAVTQGGVGADLWRDGPEHTIAPVDHFLPHAATACGAQRDSKTVSEM